MKSYWIKHENGVGVMDRRESPIPAPGPGQLLLRVRATSLSRGDLLGAIKFHRSPEGRPAGVNAAGEVEALGAGVTEFRVGERIMMRGRGCFAEYVLVDPGLATPVPPQFTWEQAAAVPTSYVTAWEAMVPWAWRSSARRAARRLPNTRVRASSTACHGRPSNWGSSIRWCPYRESPRLS